jgi:DNA-binding CsgD family transcriptional regulator
MEAGIAYLEQAREIARELGEVSELILVHMNLATVLEEGGRCADAADVYLAGLDVARRFGAFGSYGPRLLPCAATALLNLGRREEAGQLLAEAFELDLESPADRFIPLIARGNLRLWDGDLAAAQTDFRQVLAELPAPLDPVGAAEVLWYLAEAARWDGRLPDGRAAVADGLEALAGAELPYWTIQLCRTGLAVEAAAAGPGRGRRSGGEYQAIRERAAGLLDRIRSASSAPDVALTPALAASVLTAEARRARIALPPPGLPPDQSVAGQGSEPGRRVNDELGLTPREREALTLIAEGRTDRQIAEALFISPRTAAMHVSSILAKLGVANRGGAAAVAHRLRLSGQRRV